MSDPKSPPKLAELAGLPMLAKDKGMTALSRKSMTASAISAWARAWSRASKAR